MAQELASQASGNVHVLAGHSGAIVSVREDCGRNFVRKMAGSVAQNKRLEEQARKQRDFAERGGPAPPVISTGFDEHRFYFDMEYVSGVSVAHECKAGRLPNRESFLKFLRQWIGHFQSSATDDLGAQLFLAKLASIRKSVHANAAMAPIFDQVDFYIDNLSRVDWSGVPQSECHGDFTLENILITKRDYCLIDFDVPDLPSYFMDIGKLFQDIDGHWCLRHLELEAPGSIAHLNALQTLSRLRTVLMPMVEEIAPGMLPLLPTIVALNLMRVLPYCRDAAIAKFVLVRIAAVLRDIES